MTRAGARAGLGHVGAPRLSPRARASDRDPWFGADKAKHFAATFLLATGGYASTSLFDDRPSRRLAVGGALAMGTGVAKEFWDLAGHGVPSWRDLSWDGLGTAAGLVVSCLVDRLWREWHPGTALE